jgi:uncharacterized membrane protein
MTHYIYIVWFTLGLVAYWILPVSENSPASKGIGKLQHFLFCLFLGVIPLIDHVQVLKNERRKKESDKFESLHDDEYNSINSEGIAEKENKLEGLNKSETRKKLEEIAKRHNIKIDK